MRRREFITLLGGAAVAVTLIVITAFGSATFAQQSQTPLANWRGQLDLSALTPVYRNLARLDLTLNYDGRGNLRGQMAGEVSAEKTGGISCTLKVTRPAKVSANLVGTYTPKTNTMSLTITDRNVVSGSLSCPPVPGESEFGHGLIDQPVIEQLLRSLTTKADGSVEATREDTSVPQNTVRVKLTLRRDCRDPAAMSGYYTRDPFGEETPADLAPSCESCPGGTWKLSIGEVSYHPSSREPTPSEKEMMLARADPRSERGYSTIPVCAYTYESIWLCAATGEVAKRTKNKIVNESCHPKG